MVIWNIFLWSICMFQIYQYHSQLSKYRSMSQERVFSPSQFLKYKLFKFMSWWTTHWQNNFLGSLKNRYRLNRLQEIQWAHSFFKENFISRDNRSLNGKYLNLIEICTFLHSYWIAGLPSFYRIEKLLTFTKTEKMLISKIYCFYYIIVH